LSKLLPSEIAQELSAGILPAMSVRTLHLLNTFTVSPPQENQARSSPGVAGRKVISN
jgi:hypothetical protein